MVSSNSYCWQFITLAGLHSTALISDKFAKEYAKRGMRAYGELIQAPEMDNKVDVVTHQKWSGANYVDNLLKMVTGGVSSTSAMGKGVTEVCRTRFSASFFIMESTGTDTPCFNRINSNEL